MAKKQSAAPWILLGLTTVIIGGVALASAGPRSSATPPADVPQIPADRGYTVGPGCVLKVLDADAAIKWAQDLGTKATSLDSALSTAFPCAVEVASKEDLVFLYRFFYALERALLGQGVLSVLAFQKRVSEGRFLLQTNQLSLDGLPGAEPNGYAVSPDCVMSLSDQDLALLWGQYIGATLPWDQAVTQAWSGCNPNGFLTSPEFGRFAYLMLRAMLGGAVGQKTRTLDEANQMLAMAIEVMSGAGVDTAGLPGPL